MGTYGDANGFRAACLAKCAGEENCGGVVFQYYNTDKDTPKKCVFKGLEPTTRTHTRKKKDFYRRICYVGGPGGYLSPEDGSSNPVICRLFGKNVVEVADGSFIVEDDATQEPTCPQYVAPPIIISTVCGNAVVEEGEECDAGSLNGAGIANGAGYSCSTSCTAENVTMGITATENEQQVDVLVAERCINGKEAAYLNTKNACDAARDTCYSGCDSRFAPYARGCPVFDVNGVGLISDMAVCRRRCKGLEGVFGCEQVKATCYEEGGVADEFDRVNAAIQCANR